MSHAHTGFRKHFSRLIRQPDTELKRLWIYARNRDRRTAFLKFQQVYVGRNITRLGALTAHEFHPAAGKAQSCSGGTVSTPGRLRGLLVASGSDKATTHDYDVLYENFAALRGVPRLVVEIGLGTTGSGPSSMGRRGTPGASARAFRDWGSEVVGADIDTDILVDDPGIRTYFVDQLRPQTLEHLVQQLPGPIDLAIVDGLHTPEADLNSLIALAPHLSPMGLLVVEDIEPHPAISDMWREVLEQLPDDFAGSLLATRACNALIVQRSTEALPIDPQRLYPGRDSIIFTSGSFGD